MRHFAFALAACLGIAMASFCTPARAGVVVSLGIPLPGVAVAPAPLITPWPYYVYGPRYPGYVRFGYGGAFGHPYGFRPGYGHWGYARWHGR